jgi:hypothetical protein
VTLPGIWPKPATMEAIGAAASLITLIQVAGNVARQGSSLVSRYQHAPERLRRVADVVNLVYSELTIISNMRMDIANNGLLLPPADLESLSKTLQIVADSFDAIHRALEVQRTKFGKRVRLRWALWDHTRSEELELRLQQSESSLSAILQLISV